MRKSNKAKRKCKELKENYKKAFKIFEKNKDIITSENIVLSAFNFISTEMCYYMEELDNSLFEKTRGINKKLKSIMIDFKSDDLKKINLYKVFKSSKSYLKGVNRRVGDVNDFKEFRTLQESMDRVFTETEEKIKSIKKISFFEDIVGANITRFYMHVFYAINILENHIPRCFKFSGIDIKYLKTTLTKFNNSFKDLECIIMDRQEYYLKNFNELPLKSQIDYIVGANMYIIGEKYEESTKKIWGDYFKELSSYNNKRICIERDSTELLLERAEINEV